MKKRPPPTEEQVAEYRKMLANPVYLEQVSLMHCALWGLSLIQADRDVKAFMKFVRGYLQNSVQA